MIKDLNYIDLLFTYFFQNSKELFIFFWCCIAYFIGYIIYLKRSIKRLEEISQTKSFFIQKIYYELRNPLNGVIGFSQMLLSNYFGELTVKQKERIKDINKCGVEIQNLIIEFLDLSKGKNGNLELMETDVPIGELINKITEQVDYNVKVNNVNLVTHITSPDISIYCDKNKLVTAIKNLLDNAIKFSAKDSQVTFSQYLKGNFLEIIISDTGIGMTEEELASAFLFPDDIRKVKNTNGIGIGIPTAKLFITLHGGKLSLESKKELGTTAKIKLPIRRIKHI